MDMVILPHFKPDEVAALKVEHERREQVFKGRGMLGNDDERIRDAVQREAFWRQQSGEHAEDELAHALFIQGRIDEALSLVHSPERKAYFESVKLAIQRDDDERCECETPEHIVGYFPSPKHEGKMTAMYQCPECKDMNVR